MREPVHLCIRFSHLIIDIISRAKSGVCLVGNVVAQLCYESRLLIKIGKKICNAYIKSAISLFSFIHVMPSSCTLV